MELATSERGAQTRRDLRAAMERRDGDAVAALFAPDVVFHSPLIGASPFEGRDAVAGLLRAVLANFDDFHYTSEGETDEYQVLTFRARVRGREIESVDLIRVNDDGLLAEITVVIRPLAGLATVAAVLGPSVARNRAAGILLRLLAAPLAAVLHRTEPLIARLIRHG